MKQKILLIVLVPFWSGVTVLKAQTVPVITCFSPERGSAGTTVTITGSNFNTSTASNIVFFGATIYAGCNNAGATGRKGCG